MLDEGKPHEPLHALGQIPVPVGELVVHVVEHGRILDLGDPLVHGHPLQLPVHEALGHVGVPGGVHRRVDEGHGLPARLLVHRLADELAVEVIAHVRQMPVLLRPQQAPGAPDLQIPHGQPVPGPELGEFPHRQQPLLGRLGQGPALGHGEVGVGDPVRPPHPAPELVELSQPQLIRVQNHQGVAVGDVHAALHDGGAQQHVRLPPDEGQHGLFQHVLGHLPVGHDKPGLGHQLLEVAQRALHAHDLVADQEALAAPTELPADGGGDLGVGILHHVGLDREPVLRRRLDDGHVPDPGHGHVQGPGDGGGGHGQHVHLAAHGLDLLLVVHAEAVLFVDDQEP